jgi:hypothetical protein
MNKIREQGCHDNDGAYYGQHDHYDRPALSVVCHEWIPPHFGEGPTRLGSSGKELKATTTPGVAELRASRASQGTRKAPLPSPWRPAALRHLLALALCLCLQLGCIPVETSPPKRPVQRDEQLEPRHVGPLTYDGYNASVAVQERPQRANYRRLGSWAGTGTEVIIAAKPT